MRDTSEDRATDLLPAFPRRAFLAAGLSGLLSAGAVALAFWGGVTDVDEAQFQFSRGTTFTAAEETRLKAFLARALPDERVHVTIIAHSGTSGEPEANLTLSNARATRVSELAQQQIGIDADRITALGVGGAAPLARAQEESDRAYQARLARVVVSLQVRQ
ncbi:MAG: OmpA family protein [Pseudomonadota bacterium]